MRGASKLRVRMRRWIIAPMRLATGTVVGGNVVMEGDPLPKGAVVTILARGNRGVGKPRVLKWVEPRLPTLGVSCESQLFWKARASVSASLQELEKQAMELPLPDRAKLIAALIASLDSADEGDVEAAWEEEVKERSAAYHAGKVKAVPGPEAIARARSKLR